MSRQTASATATSSGLPWDKLALAVSIVILGAGVAAWAASHSPTARSSRPEPSTPVATAAAPVPTIPPPVETAAGEIAWVAEARGPVLADLDGDGVEDVFGFFREWDGRSAWTMFAGAFRGTSLAPLWRTQALDPWLLRNDGVVPTAAVVGDHLVVDDGTDQLLVYRVSGEKEATYKLAEPPRSLCATGDTNRIWIDSVRPIWFAVDSGKTQSAPTPPPGCAQRLPPATLPANAATSGVGSATLEKARRTYVECHEDFANRFSHATCIPAEALPSVAGFNGHYAVKDGTSSVELGTIGNGPRVPAAVGLSVGGSVAWQRSLAADASTKSLEAPPQIADLMGGVLYVVYDKVYFDSRLAALDAQTGATAWDVPLVDSLTRVGARTSRGSARSLVVSRERVYVARGGAGLDVFDAKTGATIGTIGGAK